MNPYELLGVSHNAGSAEIKSAYRKLVKQFHPDVASGKISDEKIKQLNEAYDILSDPKRKALYDNRYITYEAEQDEDPREKYRREYIARKRQEAVQEKQRKEARRKMVFNLARVAAFPILAFAIILVVDRFLPVRTYEEVAEKGWQERFGSTRRSQGGGELYSFMKTEHFVISVPDELHVGYNYWADEKEKLKITASLILKIPLTVSYRQGSQYYTADIYRTVYSQLIPLHFLMLASAVFTVWRKEYSKLTYSLCFLPLMLLAIVLMIMI